MQYWDDGLISVSKKNDELYHWGIKGMKWGIRRYQNEDGTLTPAGKARYLKEYQDASAKYDRDSKKAKNELETAGILAQVRAVNDPEFNKKVASRIEKEANGSNEIATAIYNDELLKVYNDNYLKAERAFNSSNKHYQKLQSMLDKYGAVDLDGVQQAWDEMERKKQN